MVDNVASYLFWCSVCAGYGRGGMLATARRKRRRLPRRLCVSRGTRRPSTTAFVCRPSSPAGSPGRRAAASWVSKRLLPFASVYCTPLAPLLVPRHAPNGRRRRQRGGSGATTAAVAQPASALERPSRRRSSCACVRGRRGGGGVVARHLLLRVEVADAPPLARRVRPPSPALVPAHAPGRRRRPVAGGRAAAERSRCAREHQRAVASAAFDGNAFEASVTNGLLQRGRPPRRRRIGRCARLPSASCSAPATSLCPMSNPHAPEQRGVQPSSAIEEGITAVVVRGRFIVLRHRRRSG